MRRSELVTVPSFSPQAAAGSSTCGAGVDGVVRSTFSETTNSSSLLQRLAHRAGARQRHRRIGRHHPQRLDLAARDRLEHLHGFQPFALGHARRIPEPAHAVDLVGREAHMRGKLVGEPADLAPAHRVGLAGQRERPHARPADPAGGEMAVDDGVDLVGALRRLVHALREAGDDARARAEQIEEARDVAFVEAGRGGGRRGRSGAISRARASAASKPVVCAVDIGPVERAGVGEMHQQPAEQRGIRAGRDRQEQVGFLGRSRCGADR